jgi:AcrR family transcriptional regulator
MSDLSKPVLETGGEYDFSTVSVGRPQRADAQRNRTRILEAAELLFSVDGVWTPVDAIAEAAGVGIGTLYRHFSTKEKLCEAVIAKRLLTLRLDAEARSEGHDPAAAFFGFLEYLVQEGSAKRDPLFAMVDADVVFEGAVMSVQEGLCVIVDSLLRRAQSVSAVRPEVTALLVVTLVVGASEAAAHEGAVPACDLLVILCDGLRPRSSESESESESQCYRP